MKPARIAEIETLPPELQAHALLDWRTVAAILNFRDIEHARETVINAGVPLVHVTAHRKLPRWGTFKTYLENRERPAA